jgi:hypothetical protein
VIVAAAFIIAVFVGGAMVGARTGAREALNQLEILAPDWRTCAGSLRIS